MDPNVGSELEVNFYMHFYPPFTVRFNTPRIIIAQTKCVVQGGEERRKCTVVCDDSCISFSECFGKTYIVNESLVCMTREFWFGVCDKCIEHL